MIFDHPSRGTCNDDSCPYVYQCHCGCGRPTALIWHPRQRRKGYVIGRPYVFVRGHNMRLPGGTPRSSYSRCGFPARAMLPDIEAAIRLFGAARHLASYLGYSEAWICLVRKGHIRRIRTGTAQRIAELARGTRSALPEPLTIRNRANKRAERARKAVA